MIADNILINLEFARELFAQLGLADCSQFFTDGASLVEAAKKTID